MTRSSMLRWQDIAAYFQCGRGKAMKILHMLDPIYVGRTPMVHASKLREYLDTHDGQITIDWRY